jgi:adenylate kinase
VILSQIFLFMGIQGSGKGTQAARLSEKLGIPHVSTGDIFRATIKQQSPLGEELRRILNSGALVPDELTSRMLGERIARPDARKGFILDGYPRTRPQVEHLDATLRDRRDAICAVFFFDLPEEEAVARLEPRRVCTANNAHIYHMVYNPPKQPGVCDMDGAPLMQRDDDKPEAIRKRVSEYLEQTIPVVEDYATHGLVHHIDAMQNIDDVTGQMLQIIEGLSC